MSETGPEPITPEDIRARYAQLEAYLHPDERELAERAAHYASDRKSHIAGIASYVSMIFPQKTMPGLYQVAFVRALQGSSYIPPQEAVEVLRQEASTDAFKGKPQFRQAYLFAAEKLKQTGHQQ